MAISLEEAYVSREGQRGQTGSSFDVAYYTFGEPDEVVAEAYVLANGPKTYRDLPLMDISHEQVTSSCYKWKMTFGVNLTGSQPGSPAVLQFQVGGGTIHITNSLSKTDYGNTTSDFTGQGFPMDFKGAIGVELNSDKTKARVRGVDVYAPILEYSYVKQFDAEEITDTYIGQIYDLAQTPVNDDEFYGRPAGSVLFRGCRGSSKGEDIWELTFDFSYSPNTTDLQVGDITGIEKLGWQYLDVIYAPPNISRTVSGTQILRPAQVTVHTVYDSGDFSTLGIGTF